MHDAAAPTEDHLDLRRLISSGQKNYSGYLTPYIKIIITMWASGYSPKQISWHLRHLVLNVTAYSHPSVASSSAVRYILKKCGVPEDATFSKANLGRYESYPFGVARSQLLWERRMMALRMRRAQLKFIEIGRRLNCSASAARQVVVRAEREANRRSPVEVYLSRNDLIPSLGPLGANALSRLARGSGGRDWLMVGTLQAKST